MPAKQRRHTAHAGAGLLDFTGERDRPALPEEVARREPVLPTAELPRELLERRLRRRLFVPGRDKPRVTVEKAQAGGTRTVWQMDVHYRERQDLSGARYARRLERVSPESLLKGIDPHIGFSGHRPPWIGAASTPRVLPHRHAPMRKLNGRLVDPLMIFYPDQRQPYMDTSFPWGLVGKIFTNQSPTKGATGALVWNDVIVTAGHVVPWSDSGGEGWMRFIPAYFDGASLFGAGVESFVSEAKGWDVAPDVTGYDWAVCRLFDPLGDLLGYFGCNGYSDAHEDEPCWTVLGYPLDVAGGERPSYQNGVSVFDDDGDKHGGKELETRADMNYGNSGGPMFGWWNDDPRIIGVVSGQEEDLQFPIFGGQGSTWGNVVAGGSGFTNLVKWARTHW
jgi:V8-like Glu-specific endopeptidase